MVNPVAALGALPTVDGFSPLPSAVADAFMAMQGGHMALYFGAYYKFSTRLVDSQQNEKFNEMADDPAKLSALLKPHHDEITRQFEHYVSQNVDKIQAIVLEKAFELEKLKVHQNVKLLKELPAEYFGLITGQSDIKNENYRPPKTDTPIGDGTPEAEAGTKFTPPSKKSAPKKSAEQTSEDNIKRMHNEVLSLQKTIERFQSGSPQQRQIVADPTDNVFYHKINNLLRIITASQLSHKENFGKYVTLN